MICRASGIGSKLELGLGLSVEALVRGSLLERVMSERREKMEKTKSIFKSMSMLKIKANHFFFAVRFSLLSHLPLGKIERGLAGVVVIINTSPRQLQPKVRLGRYH